MEETVSYMTLNGLYVTLVFWTIVGFLIHRLFKKIRSKYRDHRYFTPYLRKMGKDFRDEDDLYENWSYYCRMGNTLIHDLELQKHPDIYHRVNRELCSSFAERGEYPPDDLLRTWKTESIKLSWPERAVLVFHPYVRTVKIPGEKMRKVGKCLCVHSKKGLYIKRWRTTHFIANDNFALIQKSSDPKYKNKALLQVRSKDPPGPIWQLIGSCEDIDYLYLALTTGWNSGLKN